ncbi:uncharacterized protein [Haliotis cracherodii]|uniref:uncharacterized protein n=1 Tax=Haliotis cracherodii TaxID=6455 RepID=UPI0039E7E15D
MATQTMDDMIVQLMAMGFELPDCQDAVQYGKISVQEAVEWIIAGKPGMAKDSAQPTLKLSKDANAASSNPFVNPISLPEPSAKPDTTGQAASSSAAGKQEAEDLVVSRLHLTSQQRKVKNKFEERVREEAQKQAKEEKMKAKQERARILQQIAEDRDKAKVMRVHGPSSENVSDCESPNKKAATGSSTGSSTGSATGSVTSPETKPVDRCTLQIRFPDGRVLRQSFPPSDTLDTVWDFVYSRNRSMTNMAFIQPFPRREFSQEEQKHSLVELGLTPTGSLVLQNRSTPASQTVSRTEQAQGDVEPPLMNPPEAVRNANAAADAAPEEEEAMEDEAPPPGPPPGLPHMPDILQNPAYRWGRGQRLDNEEDQVQAMAEDQEVEDEDDEDEDFMGNILGGMGGMPRMGGHRAMRQQAFGGVGQMLVAHAHPGDDRGHHSRPAGQLAAEAARHRFVQPGPADLEPEVMCQGQHLTHDVSSLLRLCIYRVSRRLCDPRHPLLSLGGIAEELAQKLLQQLMKEGKLKAKTLQVFVPCYLRKLMFDSYPYTTNELLHAIRYHVNLVHLSLSSCTLFTDHGLKPLAGLKKLKVLNLGSCRQLSNKCLSAVAELPSLQNLNLDNTVITDAGFIDYLKSSSHQLLHLNLSRTGVSHVVIPHLRVLSKLKSLYLEQTKVCSLSGIQDLKELEILDVANTDIGTDSLLCLSGHPSLTCLSVANTENVVGDLALQYLTGLKLHTLYLPSRHTTTSQGLAHLVGLPLTSLDLTNYINVGDEGLIHIGKITSLKKLLLNNTKITDEGMLYLEGLVNLETLFLDRTLVSDVGASRMKAFTKLEELSLSSTCITSQFLCSGCLNSCHLLSKLNLSRTSVSDKGIRSLKLMSLTLLNLDGTHVHPEIISVVQSNCPNIRNITLASLNPVREEEEDMEV